MAGSPRKTVLLRETIHADGTSAATRPVSRVIVAVVVRNLMLHEPGADLTQLSDLGAALAEQYFPEAVAMLARPPVAYGKAAIVGIAGELEHAAAVLHPKLGKPMRVAVGGGEAIIPSTAKVAAAGVRIDVPLGHKDNVWSFNELDTVTIGIDDAPRADEILIVLAVSDGGRPHPRIGPGRTDL